jgi:hypothetical protein
MPDLSRMSQEERMALYKQKYYKGPVNQHVKKAVPPKRQPQKQGGQKQPDGRKRLNQQKQEPARMPAEQKPAAASPAKKGILSGLLEKLGIRIKRK